MFGFSLPKIFLLIIIILLVWNFFKFIEKKSNNKKGKDNLSSYKEKSDANEDEALIECDKCGSFYSRNLEKKCPECKNN